jgi:DNA recombination protein RmuC
VTEHVKVFGNIQEGIGKVQQTIEHLAKLEKEMGKLQDILKTPKLRGGFGEILLGNLLKDILPESCYTLQFAFQNGEKVDAAIFLAGRILPIDAKFPLESFQRMSDSEDDKEHKRACQDFAKSVKQRVDETAKYILPAQSTFEFAMMYVPAENIYYEIISNRDLFAYALAQHVIPVSPNSFYAYLNVIVFGLRGLKIEENARLIQQQIVGLGKQFEGIQTEYQTLGGHIGNANKKFEEVRHKMDRFDDKLSDISDGAALAEPSAAAALPEIN